MARRPSNKVLNRTLKEIRALVAKDSITTERGKRVGYVNPLKGWRGSFDGRVAERLRLSASTVKVHVRWLVREELLSTGTPKKPRRVVLDGWLDETK